MIILLVSPCINPDYKTPKKAMIPQLSLHILSSLTPSTHRVIIVEEEYEKIPFDAECDLVGISCFTANAPRAYEIAGEFRRRGKAVVLGGIHPTLLPDEALRHADAVIAGEAEGVWEMMLQDFERGEMKKIYRCSDTPLDAYYPPRAAGSRLKRPFRGVPVMTTRGCPHECEFCSVSRIYGKKIRHAPVDHVVRYVRESGGRYFIFHDDNIIGDRKYARELFTALAKLRIRWVGQGSVSLAKYPDLMKLAYDSGCRALLFGVESVAAGGRRYPGKSFRHTDEIGEAIRAIRASGILFHASLVFGFDEDEVSVFPETLAFLIRNCVTTASFNILTPYPGTAIYESMKREGRLVTGDWRHYDTETVVYTPARMSPIELHAGKIWIKRRFFSMQSILRRLPDNMDCPLLYAIVSMGLRESARAEMKRFPEKARLLYGCGGEEAREKYRTLEKQLNSEYARMTSPESRLRNAPSDYSALDN